MRQRIAQDAADKFDNTPKYGVNDTFVMTGADGTQVSGVVQRTDDDGVEAAVGDRVVLIPTEQFEAQVQEVRDAYGNVAWRRTPEDAAEADVQENGINGGDKEALPPNSSERHLAEHRDGVPDLLPTQEGNASTDVPHNSGTERSVGKGTEGNANRQAESVLGEASEQKNGIILSDEIDDNGRQFVLASDGRLPFGEISEESGLTPAPILLSEGVITNPATNDGYGLVHIEARHGEQIRKAGYKSVLDFIEKVAKNYDVIKEDNVRDGRQTYRIQLTDRHNNTLMVELSNDGTYWNINTAGIFKTSYGGKNKEVYNRHTTDRQSAGIAGTSQDVEQRGTQTSSSMNAPTTSVGKDTEQNSDMQAEGVENASALSRIPKDADGEPVYTAADAYTAWDALVEQCGGDAGMAQGVADSMVKDMEAALKKAEKSAPAHGVTVAEKIAAAKGHKAAVEKARDELGKWRAIAGETASRARAAEEAERRRKRERLDNAREELRRKGRYAKEDAALGDYTDFTDFVMRTIATGKYRFLWRGKESGTQGLGAHLGFTGSRTERNRRIWLLSRDGYTPEEAAERMLADYSAAAGFDSVEDTGVDSMEALDVVLDVLRRYTSPRAMMDDAEAAHAESGESADERRQREEYERGQFMEAYHMTPEEYYEYENEWLPRYLEEAAEVPQEVIDNINADSAEKENLNGKDDYTGGADARGVPPVHGERADNPGGDKGGEDPGGAAGAVGEGDAAGGLVPQGAPGGEVRSDAKPTLGDVIGTLYTKGKEAASKIFGMKFFDVANTPKFMQDLGLGGKKFTIRYGVIARHFGKDGSHNLTEAEWRQLPDALQKPFAIASLSGRERAYRLYTSLKTEKGEYVAVGVDVKNAGRDMEVNSIATVFGRREGAGLPGNESVIYRSDAITPEQEALLSRPNSDQYPSTRELSEGKVTEESSDLQENGGKDAESKAETPLSEQIDAASAEVNTEPTEAQKKAGNYKKGHVQVGTFDITIEQPQGSVRRGTDANGKKWESKMHNTYGYFRGTEGVDGDHIDVFLSNDIDGWNGRKVYVVDQYNPDGTFDEHKVMLGFNDMDEAKGDYLANYEKGWEAGRRIDVSAVNLEDFEKWIGSSHRKTKPFAEYAVVKEETVENGILKGEKWRSTGEPEKYRVKKKGDSHDVVWQVGKKRYGSTTAERDLIDVLRDEYGGYIGAWNAYERGEADMNANEAAILKALLTAYEKKETSKVSRLFRDLPEERTLQKVDETTGKTLMYHRGDVVAPLTSEERALRDAVVDRLREGGMDVITDVEEGQRVLGMADGARMEARRRSDDAGRRNRMWQTVDRATALATGRTEKEVRRERQERMRKFRVETKELYGRVLSGNFDDVTLQLINNHIDNATPDNRYWRPLSKRLPQGVERSLRKGERTGAVDALFSRICEGAVEKDGRTGAEARRRVEEKKEELLKKWAVATGNWHTDVSDFGAGETPIGSGKDSVVYQSKDGKYVVKVSKGKFESRKFPTDVDQVALFNYVFPNSRYEILGYGEVGGKFVKFLKQPFVDFSTSVPLTTDERTEYMRKLGFEPLNEERTVFSNGSIVVSDLQKSNIVRDKAGNVRVIDADVKLHTKDIGGNWSYPGVETDTETADAVREHRVYHGSGADFDAFDHSHMGEGEGAQAYGWGTYVTEVEGIGRAYAKANPGEAEYPDDEREDAQRERAEKVLEKYGVDDGLVLDYDGAGGFYEFDVPRDKDTLEQFMQYFKEHEDEFYGLNPVDDFDLDDESDRESFASAVEDSILDYAKEVAGDYDYLCGFERRMLYTVEIPDDNGGNYLEWNKPLPDTIDKEALAAKTLTAVQTENPESDVELEVLERDIADSIEDAGTGEYLYKAIRLYVGDKNASKILSDLGFTGIKYPAQYRSGGRADGAKDYVIFNEKDARITDKVRFFRTANGEAYGFTVGGRIYIDPEIANAETPVHEYAHLWASALRGGNAEEWKNVVGLMKGTPVWDEVKKRYPELETDDEIADEVIATYSGRRGAERLREEARKIADGNGGVFEKAEAVSALERVREALRRFWKAVADFLHIHYTSADEVADRVMKDLLDGVDPRKFGNGGKDAVRLSARQKRALETASVSRDKKHHPTVVSSADGAKETATIAGNPTNKATGVSDARAKVQTNLDSLAESYGEKGTNKTRGFITDLSRALGLERHEASNYGSFDLPNGNRLAIRVSNHNARVSNFDRNNEDNGISIVISSHRNRGLDNDGTAHLVEYFYNRRSIENAEGKPLAEIVRSIRQALYSGEFRDTTGLAEVQEVNAGDIVRYQFIGEKGAEAADRAEEATVRLDNLSVARDMEKAGKDAKAIKLATGWERGADGKWRYEIPDIEYVPDGDARFGKAYAAWPLRKEYDALTDKVIESDGRLSDEEQKRFDELSDEYNEFRKVFKDGVDDHPHLDDYVRADELFRAYPGLKGMPLMFINDPHSNVGAYYDPHGGGHGEGMIAVNVANTVFYNKVLAHEIQHAIQHIEGFAGGGNIGMMEEAKHKIREVRERVSDGLDKAARLAGVPTADEWIRSLDKGAADELASKMKEYRNSGHLLQSALLRVYLDSAGFKDADRELLKSKLDEAEKIIGKQSKIIGGKTDLAPSDIYRSLGGEVEARNVERRIRMTPEERRASLAADTEDVAREDQIFLERGLGGAGESMAEARQERTDDDLERVNGEFNEQLDKWQEGTLNAGDYLNAGLPSGTIAQFMPDVPIIIRQKVLRKSAKKHGLSASDMKDLPKAMRSPIFIFKGNESTISILTELKSSEGRNVFVAVELGKEKQMGHRFMEVNDILTIHGRETENVVNPIAENNSLVWADKEKGLNWLSSAKSKSQAIANEVLDTAANVVRNFENPKVPGEKVADGEYLEAVKSGDMDASVDAATDIVADEEDETSDDKTKFRLLEDDDPKAKELEALPDSELVPVYRNVQAFEDDALGSPMAFIDADTGERRTLEGSKWNYSNPQPIKLTPEQQKLLDELNRNGYLMVDGKKTTELPINEGLKFVKGKTKDAQLQYFLKKNPEDKGLWAAYDPYDHAIETPLNTQFGEAYKRPNLVVVRSLIPKSEIDEPFYADYALLPTGAHQWNNGRTLYLSRWSKIDKVLTREEEAKMIDEYWKKHPGKREALKSHRDYNRFVPQVRRELEKMGYRFELDGKELTPEESRALDEQNWESRDVIPGREGHIPFVSNEDIARINAKMAGKWVGEPKEAMENAMTERVNELAEILNTPVRIVRTDAEVAALPSVRQRRMKGSFNPMTGEVTVVIPNHANVADVENTVLHEVVGHGGLRVLFPEEEKLNNALDELYRVSKDGIQESIDRMARKMYDAEVDRLMKRKRREHEAKGENADAYYYTDLAEAHVEAGGKRGQFRRNAAEEYAADLAGRIGEKGFEKMSAEELTFWGRLKAVLQNALRKLAEGLGIPGVRKWGDKEWAFVLHEAYKRKRNGGRPSVADAADTVVAREGAGFDGMSGYGATENERFNEELDEVNKRFNEQLEELTEENADKMALSLGRPSKTLASAGIPDRDIRLYGNKAVKKAAAHGYSVKELRDLPNAVQDPIAVFKGSYDGSFSVLTELKLNGGNALVSIDVNKGEVQDINLVTSVYGKDNNKVAAWINKGMMLYADKERTLGYISSSAPIADATHSQEFLSAAKIVENFENPKVFDEKAAERELYRVGDVKTFRDGRGIEFRRKPTATFNALLAHLEKEGVKAARHKARTGSEYAEFSRYGVMYEVRSADHTKPGSAYDRADKSGVEVEADTDGMIRHIGIDLVQAEMNAADVYALMDEAERFNRDDEAVRRAATEDGAGSAEFRDAYPTLWRVMELKSPEEARMARLRREYNDYVKEETERLLPFTASNGVTYRGWLNNRYTYPESIAPQERRRARKVAESEYEEAVRKVRSLTFDDFVRQREQEDANRKSAVEAMRKIADGADYVPDAVVREDLERYGGDRNVGLYWGETGNPARNFKGGYGLAHIGAKHGGEVVRQIVDVLCKGKIDRYVEGNKTVILSNGRFECVLALTRNGGKETWLLTGWDKIEKAGGNSEVSTRSVPMQGSPTFSRTDLGAALSAAKVAEKSESPRTAGGESYIPASFGYRRNVSDEELMFRDGDEAEYRKALARDIYERRVSRGLYQTQEALQDSMLGLKEAMDAILKAEGRGGTYIEDVAGFENAYLGENRLSSVNQAECSVFGQRLFKPLLKEAARLAKTAGERAELTDYMMAKHGLERNVVMARRDARKKAREEFAKDASVDVAARERELYLENRERDYAGLTALTGTDNVADAEAEARRMVADYEGAHTVRTLWDRVNAVNAATLLKSYESGMISRETYDDIRGMYKNYIPLRGFDEKTAEDAYAYVSSDNRGGFNAPIRTAKGRKSKADDPFANMEAMAESAIMQGNRNVLVKQRFMNFAVNHPSDLLNGKFECVLALTRRRRRKPLLFR